jgi:hypothetical protein
VLLALGAAACGELPDPTTVKDLRVLAIKCEPAGFLVDLNDPGSASEAALTAQLTALVVDPTGGSQEVSLSGVGCPDYIDTITSATLQGTKLCPPESATSSFPPAIADLLRTVTIIPADAPQSFPPAMTNDPSILNDYEYHPTLAFGLRPDQIAAFFSPTGFGVPAVDESIALNRDFGLPAIVNMSIDLNGQHADALKRVVYWPLLEYGQQPNKNPTLDAIKLYRHRDDATGNPIDEIDLAMNPIPTVSISAKDKLFVEPSYANAVESYLLRVNDVENMRVYTRMVERELLQFQFYATAGTFTPGQQFSELNPILSGGTLHTDSEYVLPKIEDRPADGRVTIWIVTHDERAGSDWKSVTINVDP